MRLISQNRLLIVVTLVIVIFFGLFLLTKVKVGDIRPALLPNNNSTYESLSSLKVSNGYDVSHFATGVPGARDLEQTDDGTILLSQTSQGKIVTLPDKKIVLENLNGPHGLAFRNGYLFVAEKDKVNRYKWNEELKTATLDKKLFDLPQGGGHSTRSLVFSPDGKLLVSTGSSCNVCVEKDPMRAAVFVSDENGTTPKLFAKGLRNSVFMTINPDTAEVWAADMGRDLLGDNVPPEEINILKAGNDYGWPYCFGNKVHDNNFDPNNSVSCEQTTPPLYEFQAHSAPLGLAFVDGDLLVSYHGSWNRSIPTGYKVVKMTVEGNRITKEEDFLTGFIENSDAKGRPVDILEQNGNIYISDDKAGVVYLLTKN